MTGNPQGAAPGRAEKAQRRRLAVWLRRPRYEVLALAGTAEQVQQHVPTALPVTVTASPRRGLEPTLALTEALAGLGYSAVPHLAARLVYDDAHLSDILARLDAVGTTDVFVVSGDGEKPLGTFADSIQLLSAITRLREAGSAPGLAALGVAGYPEGHPLVGDEELAEALLTKQSQSRYVVTQMCFDAGAVSGWVDRTRAIGLRLPVHAGVAGPVDRLRLLRVAGRIGVGTSMRFLRKQRGGSALLRLGGYRPDRLLADLAFAGVRTEPDLAGLHVYTLGDVAATERWRRELLDRLSEGEEGHG